ncbi:MAG: DUF2339 domain-containing protein [Elusimicrobia bacterium]|nr:DUF2339 domain-containing protein [Elusimicrobiota bacterium]
MLGLGMLYMLVIAGIVAVPFLSLAAFVRVGSLQKRLDLLQRELDILRLSPGSLSSEEILRRVARLEERLDHLKGVLRSGATSMKGAGEPEPSVPPAVLRVPPPPLPAPSLPPTIPPVVPPARPTVIPPEPVRTGAAVSLPLTKTPPPSRPPILEPEPSSTKSFAIDWDQFTGVKLFSWIGGFALFLGAVFFVKYSIDHGWVSPMMRVLSGFVLGTAAIVLGIQTQKRGYDVTGQTLAAAGCAILYADAFAAHALYDLLGAGAAFAFMALVTAVAFSLAVKMDSQYVAILGLVGGFLTPPLLSTGVDRALGLFSYVTLLDIGLLLVALRKRWMFLISLAAVGTLCMQIGWAVKFFEASKMATAAGISLWFSVFFAAARLWAEGTEKEDSHSLSVAGAMPLAAILCAFVSLTNSSVAAHPTIAFALLFLADAILAGLAYRREKLQPVHVLAGAVAFIALLVWTGGSLSPSTLPHALAVYLLLGALHGAFAVVLHRKGGTRGVVTLGQLYPAVFLIPLMMALTRQLVSPAFLWPVIFLLNAITIVAAIATGFLWALIGALGLSLLAASLWLTQLSAGDLPGLLVVIGGVAALFFGAGLWVQRGKNRTAPDESTTQPEGASLPSGLTDAIPALGSLLPFLLLGQAAIHLKLANPAPVFGLGFLLVLLLLGLASRRGAGAGFWSRSPCSAWSSCSSSGMEPSSTPTIPSSPRPGIWRPWAFS